MFLEPTKEKAKNFLTKSMMFISICMSNLVEIRHQLDNSEEIEVRMTIDDANQPPKP